MQMARRLLTCVLATCVVVASRQVTASKSSSSLFQQTGSNKCNSKFEQCLTSRSGETSRNLLSIRGGAGAGEAAAEIVAQRGIPLYAVKILLQLSLSLLNIVCWIIPLKTKSFAQNAGLLSVANAFAGGIFLMLGLGHLVPHALETLDSIHASRNHAFYSAIAGFLLMLFIEKVAFNSHALLHAATGDDGHAGHDHFHAQAPTAAAPVLAAAPAAPAVSSTTDNPIVPAAVAPISSDSSAACTLDHDHSLHAHSDTAASKAALSATSAIVLLVAMSVHSLFETMALGIASDSVSAVMMSLSIALHQPAESIALLVAFLKTNMPVETVIRWLGAFSAVGPLGVGLGLLVSNIATPFVDAVLVAITAGTFLYVGATEVCNEEFEGKTFRSRATRFAALLGGVVMIGGISELSGRWFGDHHSHSHSHSHAH